MRYSRRFRVFAGFLCWITGILNFGIFPAVAARFFIYFCGLPDYFNVAGVSLSTFATIMAVDLILALMFVTKGGQISVMITECMQGIFCGFAFIVVSAAIILNLEWSQVVHALNMAPSNASLIHPFHMGGVKDFNIWYFLIGFFGAFYGYMTWQGSSGFNSAARSPHEQKMGGIIGIWRQLPQALMTLLLALAAYIVMHIPEFSAKAALVNETLRHIDNPAVRDQMRVPVALANFLPAGIKGIFATIMVFASFTCHDTYMHSWGSIFIQDVYMPLRNRPLSQAEHIRLLRWSIIGVAVFAFLFSLLYPQNGKILMFFAITGTIWIGGSGAVVIGGLYWKRGTTAAAYTSLIVGAVLGVSGLIIPQIYQNHYHRDFPVNGQWLYFIAMCLAILCYVVVSLLTGGREREFNLDRMLRRGEYSSTDTALVDEVKQSRWLQVVGINKDFSRTDRSLAIGLVVWNAGWFAAFVVGTIINLTCHIDNAAWLKFWHFYIMLYFVMCIPITIWFTIGGIIDMKALIKTLASTVRDHADDGRVVAESTFIEEENEQVLAAKQGE